MFLVAYEWGSQDGIRLLVTISLDMDVKQLGKKKIAKLISAQIHKKCVLLRAPSLPQPSRIVVFIAANDDLSCPPHQDNRVYHSACITI